MIAGKCCGLARGWLLQGDLLAIIFRLQRVERVHNSQEGEKTPIHNSMVCSGYFSSQARAGHHPRNSAGEPRRGMPEAPRLIGEEGRGRAGMLDLHFVKWIRGLFSLYL